jgi:hypothetical protein
MSQQCWMPEKQCPPPTERGPARNCLRADPACGTGVARALGLKELAFAK